MNKFDGSLASSYKNSKVISDDEVIDPESPDQSPVGRQRTSPITLRSQIHIHEPRVKLEKSRKRREVEGI